MQIKDIYSGRQSQKSIIGTRLADSPCVLITGKYGWLANMEKIMKGQTLKSFNVKPHCFQEANLRNKVEFYF